MWAQMKGLIYLQKNIYLQKKKKNFLPMITIWIPRFKVSTLLHCIIIFCSYECNWGMKTKEKKTNIIIKIYHLTPQKKAKHLFLPMRKEVTFSTEKCFMGFVRSLTDLFHLGFVSAGLAHCTAVLEAWYPVSKMSKLFLLGQQNIRIAC